MSNLFSRIHKAATKTVNMENKIDSLADIAREIAITDEKDFFIARDFEGDLSQIMTQPEQLGPLVNTLLQYIVLRETVPMSLWEQMQTDFERKIQSGWSYRTWHENRPQLYELVDKSKKNTGRVGAVGINRTDVNISEGDVDSSFIVEEDNIDSADGKMCPVYPKYGKQPRRTYDSGRSEDYHTPPLSQAERMRANHQAPRKSRSLCLNCSHHHPHRLTVYHPEGSGFGGKGKYCLFDADGNERNDARGRNIHAIGSEFKFIEADGAYPIMADVEMFDKPTDRDMTSQLGIDLLPDVNH